MRVVVPREQAPGETRVGLTPTAAGKLVSGGTEVVIEAGAGAAAAFADAEYREAGASIATDASRLFEGAEVIIQVIGPRAEEAADVERLPSDAVLISFLKPREQPDLMERLAARGVTSLAMELMPRTTVAQRMDALSAMATVAGYSAVLRGATTLHKFLPMLTTAAGTIAPAKVLVIGAGVAGLQAIATARRLGAVVEAFDIRPAAKEQVESLGAQFVEWEAEEDAVLETAGGYAAEVSENEQEREQQLLARHVAASDMVITTAAVPGKAAPKLITPGMVDAMRAGSVIVDVAAGSGGNCELTVPGESARHDGVTILGPRDLATSLPTHASDMYARTVSALLQHLAPEGKLRIDLEDEITAACCVTQDGKVRQQS